MNSTAALKCRSIFKFSLLTQITSVSFKVSQKFSEGVDSYVRHSCAAGASLFNCITDCLMYASMFFSLTNRPGLCRRHDAVASHTGWVGTWYSACSTRRKQDLVWASTGRKWSRSRGKRPRCSAHHQWHIPC